MWTLRITILEGQCVHRHRFQPQQRDSHAIGDWIGLYNHRSPQQPMDVRTPDEAFALAV
jgi:putative transposase